MGWRAWSTGFDLRGYSSVSVPVGRSVTGSQVFACLDPCGDAVRVNPRMGYRGRVVSGESHHRPEHGSASAEPGAVGAVACTLLVALGAAYASYRHGREFALRFGADATTADSWPLIVDGLLTTATVELWKTRQDQRGGGWSAWLAFLFGIVLSLCTNIAAGPELSVFAVAACMPLALLLAVELPRSASSYAGAQKRPDSGHGSPHRR